VLSSSLISILVKNILNLLPLNWTKFSLKPKKSLQLCSFCLLVVIQWVLYKPLQNQKVLHGVNKSKLYLLDKVKMLQLKLILMKRLILVVGLYFKTAIFLRIGCQNLKVSVKNYFQKLLKISDYGWQVIHHLNFHLLFYKWV